MTKIHASQTEIEGEERFPYVGMSVLLRVRGSGERRRSARVGGMTLTSEPVSTKKLVFVFVSLT